MKSMQVPVLIARPFGPYTGSAIFFRNRERMRRRRSCDWHTHCARFDKDTQNCNHQVSRVHFEMTRAHA